MRSRIGRGVRLASIWIGWALFSAFSFTAWRLVGSAASFGVLNPTVDSNLLLRPVEPTSPVFTALVFAVVVSLVAAAFGFAIGPALRRLWPAAMWTVLSAAATPVILMACVAGAVRADAPWAMHPALGLIPSEGARLYGAPLVVGLPALAFLIAVWARLSLQRLSARDES